MPCSPIWKSMVRWCIEVGILAILFSKLNSPLNINRSPCCIGAHGLQRIEYPCLIAICELKIAKDAMHTNCISRLQLFALDSRVCRLMHLYHHQETWFTVGTRCHESRGSRLMYSHKALYELLLASAPKKCKKSTRTNRKWSKLLRLDYNIHVTTTSIHKNNTPRFHYTFIIIVYGACCVEVAGRSLRLWPR